VKVSRGRGGELLAKGTAAGIEIGGNEKSDFGGPLKAKEGSSLLGEVSKGVAKKGATVVWGIRIWKGPEAGSRQGKKMRRH